MIRLIAVALAAFFVAGSASAQNQGTVTNHAFAIGKGAGTTGYASLLCGSAQLAVGQAAADPICRTMSGDATFSAAGALTLATINANVGSFGSATQCVAITVNAKGLITAASAATCAPAIGSITGLGTGVATWLATPSSANLRAALTDEVGTGTAYFVGGALGTPASGTATNLTGMPISTGLTGAGTGVLTALGVNVGAAGSFVVNGGALGTPSSGVATNLTGTASSLTAGAVPASGITGTTLAPNVTASSLTSAAGGSFGTAAFLNTGTSGATIARLDGANSWSQGAAFGGNNQVGAGGTAASAPAYVTINGSSGTAGGAAQLYQKNATYQWGHGHVSSIAGSGSSSDFELYNYGAAAPAFTVTLSDNSVAFSANIATPTPTTKTTNYSVVATDSSLIFNGAGSITLTLPSAASYPGRWISLKNIAAQTVVSASSNVVPQAGGAAGTAILAATAGKWARLQSDGSNWQIMESN